MTGLEDLHHLSLIRISLAILKMGTTSWSLSIKWKSTLKIIWVILFIASVI
jgi:hypothetical protein